MVSVWCALLVQQLTLKTTVPLVVAPVAVTDSAGKPVDGLTAGDLVLYDNSVPQRIHLEPVRLPVSLVVAVATRTPEVAGKMAKSASLIEPLVAGAGGEVAVVSFAGHIRVEQDFTSDPDRIARALRGIQGGGAQCRSIDAVVRAVDMLARRPEKSRRVILLIAEKRDRGSESTLEEAVGRAQRANVTIYPVTYSPFFAPFTARGQDPSSGPRTGLDLLAVFREMRVMAATDVAAAFAKYTGARTLSFVRQRGLEQAIMQLGEELHTQYLVSFRPMNEVPGQYHEIRVAAPGRPDVSVRTRPGYWTVE